MTLPFAPLDVATFREKLLDAAVVARAQDQWEPSTPAKVRQDLEERVKELAAYGGRRNNVLDEALQVFSSGWLNPQMAQDMSVVQFSCENVLTAADEHLRRGDGFRGVQERADGLVFYGLEAGGDWEWPVSFIVYFDGTQFRGYIPQTGNAFNKKTRTAYGSEEDSQTNPQESYDDPGHLPERLQAKTALMLADIDAAFGLGPAPLAAPTSADCKVLLDTDDMVKNAGGRGPWKRISKSGNAESGIVRVFQGKQGFVAVMEKTMP